MKSIFFLFLSFLFISCKQPVSKKIVQTKNLEIRATETPTEKKTKIFSLLQGTWVNIETPISSLTFADNKVINKHDGVAVKKNILFSIQNSCGATAAGETPEERDKYIVTSGDTAECYYIVQLDDENLILGFWGEETALRFKKATNY
jgi:hypothetical protein